MIEKNFYLETYKKYYINKKEDLSINKVKNILTNFCHMQDLINININDLAACLGNVLKNINKENKNKKNLETKNNLEIEINFEKNSQKESKIFAEKKFCLKKYAFKKKDFYLENFDENNKQDLLKDEFKQDLVKNELIKNTKTDDKNLNVNKYLKKRNNFFRGKKEEEINKEVFDMDLEEIYEDYSSDKNDEFDNILNIRKELKFFKKNNSKKNKLI